MTVIETKYGRFIAQHTANELRRKEILPVEYHGTGTVKSLPLETQTTIATPAGDMPAELVTFHPNGSLNRVFPLNGKLSGYWSEEDEAALVKPAVIATPAGVVSAKVIGVGFYDDGTLRSITLWPGETVTLRTPAGPLEIRIGISFATDGTLQSVEPAKPTPIKTSVGEIMAYDPDAVGVNGDVNSVAFDGQGNVIRVATTLTRLRAVHSDGSTSKFAPEYRESLCGDTEQEVVPMIVEMDDKAVQIRMDWEAAPSSVPREKHIFFAEPFLPQFGEPLGIMNCSV